MLRINSCQWSSVVGTSLTSHPTSHPVQDSGTSWKRGWKECKSERMGREVWMAGAGIWTGQSCCTRELSNCGHPHIFKCIFPQHPSLRGPGSKSGLCRMLQLRDKWEFWRLCWPYYFQGHLSSSADSVWMGNLSRTAWVTVTSLLQWPKKHAHMAHCAGELLNVCLAV